MKKYIVALMSLFLMFYLSGCGSGSGSTSDSNQTQVTNKPPLAIAGADKIVQEGTSITLDASKSTDSDGNIIKYEWFENNTLLGNTKTLTKVFTKGIHAITLKATDNKNASSTDSIKVTVKEKVNAKPIANAGENQTKEVGSSITLDASKSSDSDGNIIKYEWFENNQLLSNEKSFIKNDFSVGEHTITLKVTDDKEATNSTSVVITITAKEQTPAPSPSPTNKPPVANAGDEQTVQEGQSVTLDASKSSDSDGSITKYEWFEGATSLGVGQTLTKSDFSVGAHTITLKVTDNNGATNSDSVKVTITDITPPTATITPANMATDVSLDSNITITFSEKVKGIDDKNITLSKAGSTIPLAYTLTNDNNTTLTLNPTSVFEFNTNYTLTIKNVTDNAGNTISSNPTTSTFTTIPQPVARTITLLKTGQITSYQAKDDGDYKKGVARSYTRVELNATAGIVTDNATGFMWQDDSESSTTQRAWNEAKTYCDTLTLGGFDDWRLPNINELETIVDYGRRRDNPENSLGAIDPIFKYVNQTAYQIIYWSSTAHLSDTSSVWSVAFYNGNDYLNDKVSSREYVRCIR